MSASTPTETSRLGQSALGAQPVHSGPIIFAMPERSATGFGGRPEYSGYFSKALWAATFGVSEQSARVVALVSFVGSSGSVRAQNGVEATTISIVHG